MSSWALSAVLLACAAGHRPPEQAAPDPNRAPLGVRIQELPEGELVVGVGVGTGAERAGLVPGDLIVQVEDIDVRKAPTAARCALRGPVGSPVRLVVRGPDDGDYRELSVERGVQGDPGLALPAVPGSVRTLRRALLRARPAAARRAAQAAVADGFGGVAPADAVRVALRTAAREHPAVARAAAQVLSDAELGDPALDRELGLSWSRTGQAALAVGALQAAEAGRPPDTWDPAGSWRGDAGGQAELRALLTMSLLASDRRAEAEQVARDLLRAGDHPPLRQALGMAALHSPSPWRAALPPLAELQATTLDGSAWSLDQHRGQVVVLAFFATWCGPCRQELPELRRLWERQQDQGLQVLAVSIDDDATVEALPAFARSLDLPFPVVHAPELARRFEIDGIPAVRVIDRQGSLVYQGRGYSSDGLGALAEAIGQALSGGGPEAGQAVLGLAWSSGQASLVDFLGVPGADGLVVAQEQVAISRDQGPPLVLSLDGAISGSRVEGPGGGALVAWDQGPATAAPGQYWVRGTTVGGRPRWLLTTGAPVRALVGDGTLLWVATDQELLAVDELGRLVHQEPGGAKGLAANAEGGVWAVDGQGRRHVQVDSPVGAVLPAPGAAHVDASGRTATDDFPQILTGRFGPQGAPRTVLVRGDGGVVGLDAQGAPAFTWALSDPPAIAALDTDGDGQDELLVAIRHQGLATVSLVLP